MKCALNADMCIKKSLSIGFVLLLLMSMATVAIADDWDGVVGDPTPAQAVWVDPKNTTGLSIGDEFVVDVITNITARTRRPLRLMGCSASSTSSSGTHPY